MNNNNPLSQTQLGSLQLLASMEKERANESRYLALYTDLLQSRLHVLRKNDSSQHTDANNYAEETRILKKAISHERKAWASGLAIGCLVFVSIRKLPFWATRLVGGKAKLQSMYDAEIAASKRTNSHLQRMGCTFFTSFLNEYPFILYFVT